MYITDLTHFLDGSGAIAPIKGPARAMAQFVVDQAPDDRKQQRRMSRPRLAGLPEQFLRLRVTQRA